MIISSKGLYALRLMIEIGLNQGRGPVRIKEVSENQDISAKYLEQIAAALTRGGFVKSVRGAQGGYYLTREPKEYTVGMILRLIEGCMVPVGCMESERNSCERADRCVILPIWVELDQAVRGVLDKYTLQELMDWALQGMEVG